MRTIKTHFLFLALTSLGFAATAYADGKNVPSGSSARVTTSKHFDDNKTVKTDSTVKVDAGKVKLPDTAKTLPKGDPFKPKTDPIVKKDTVKVDTIKKTDVVKTTEITKSPTMVDKRVVQVHDASKVKVDTKVPAIKLNNDAKFDQGEFAKLKPKIDLTKVKPETVLNSKPPSDFKVKPIKLDQIQLPKDAKKVDVLNAGMKFNGEKFIMNKNFCTTPNYHVLHGVKCSYGYCYPGKHHCHWHHSIWDPCYSCYYYYCPSACCYYYWNEVSCCYAPCYWFVEYQGCSYPWWLCGGFENYGYCGSVGINIHVGISIK